MEFDLVLKLASAVLGAGVIFGLCCSGEEMLSSVFNRAENVER